MASMQAAIRQRDSAGGLTGPRSESRRVCALYQGLARLAMLAGISSALILRGGTVQSDFEIKGVYLVSFAEFIEWPAASFAGRDAPMVIGVLGDDPFGEVIENLKSRRINGRTIEIKRFKGGMEFRGEETPGRRQDDLAARRHRKIQELKSCHILYISSSEKWILPSVLKPLRTASVVTIGEGSEFSRQGGIISFVRIEGRLQIEINLRTAKAANLQISSKLLSLARVIDADFD